MSRILFIMLFLSSITMIYAQDWQDTTNALGEPVRMMAEKENTMVKIADKDLVNVWDACKKLTVLQNPSCRCLPTLQGTLVVWFQDHQVVVVELVQDHWFHLVYVGNGRVVSFLMKDDTNLVWSLVEEAMKEKATKKANKQAKNLTPQPVAAPPSEESSEPVLCPECQGKMFAMMIGKCSACSNTTPSIAYKFCAACGKSNNACCACGKKLK